MALKYTVQMPPQPAISDLATREVTIALNGEEDVRSLQPDDETFQFICEPGTPVTLWCVDIDTSGNRSEKSPVLAFTATDTVPPPAPGGMAVTSVEQVDTPAAPAPGKPRKP